LTRKNLYGEKKLREDESVEERSELEIRKEKQEIGTGKRSHQGKCGHFIGEEKNGCNGRSYEREKNVHAGEKAGTGHTVTEP